MPPAVLRGSTHSTYKHTTHVHAHNTHHTNRVPLTVAIRALVASFRLDHRSWCLCLCRKFKVKTEPQQVLYFTALHSEGLTRRRRRCRSHLFLAFLVFHLLRISPPSFEEQTTEYEEECILVVVV